MKKCIGILFISLVLLTFNLQAQDNYKRFHFGPKIGLSATDIRYKDLQYDEYQFINDTIAYTNVMFSISAGLAIDYSIIPTKNYGMSIQTALIYSRKGCTLFTESIDEPSESINVMMHYLDIPVELRAKCHIAKRNYLVLGFGPTFNIGISQVNDITEYRSDEPNKKHTNNLQFGEGDRDNGLHRLDIGANAILGIESTGGFRFDLSYYIPLRNLSIDTSKTVKHFVFAASVGYMF